MFSPNTVLIDAFVAHTVQAYRSLFSDAEPVQIQALERAAHTALETLLHCDCSYHDIQHTILVTEVGQTILHGRQLARGDLTAHEWLQAVVAMLFHDVGYLRNLMPSDRDNSCVINPQGERFTPPAGATDAAMTPYHVTRSAMYVRERFANEPAIDTTMVSQCIEMTRFPVPLASKYRVTDSLPALVRCADLIGQMADPQYPQKLSRLFVEFIETGEARRMGFANAESLRQGFPQFFYSDVLPYIGDGVAYLKKTQQGQQWIANLYHHLHTYQSAHEHDPRIRAPELVVDNSRA